MVRNVVYGRKRIPPVNRYGTVAILLRDGHGLLTLVGGVTRVTEGGRQGSHGIPLVQPFSSLLVTQCRCICSVTVCAAL